jgi:hypothetical protein
MFTKRSRCGGTGDTISTTYSWTMAPVRASATCWSATTLADTSTNRSRGQRTVKDAMSGAWR